MSTTTDSRLKWKKRKKQRQEDEEDEDEDEDEVIEEEEEEDDSSLALTPLIDPREIEILSDGSSRISDFPAVIKHPVNRPHSSVLSIVAAERNQNPNWKNPFFLENISHGQLQVLSSIPSDSPSLAQQDLNNLDSSSSSFSYVCTPPSIMEGKGVVKRFGNQRVLVVPMHADWFSPTTVHRLERQVVPHFFSGKSSNHTPEKYIELRNKIVAKYMENPDKRLSVGDCQGLIVDIDVPDLNRVVRFLDHWGVINYMAPPPAQPKIGGPLLREDVNGEIHIPSVAFRSIDSLIHFDKPKCRFRPEDLSFPGSGGVPDLDSKIRERLSENRCNYCTRPLPHKYYQSQKEADIVLCSDCFHDGKFVAGNTSIDFMRVDSTKDLFDLDGDNWTDQETLLLLEALEIYNDNWNNIADHVGTKSKAQCILHFIRLPMEDGLLETIELPSMAVSSDISKKDDNGKSYSNSVGYSEGVCLHDLDSENRLPFANSGNPVMSLVAFLASAVGPRVAAACAHASLASLSKDDHGLVATSGTVQKEGSVHGDRLNSESMSMDGGSQGTISRLSHQKEETPVVKGLDDKDNSVGAPLSLERVKAAAKSGLSAAAMKAKLFADHEEREIQRLSATIINHQLKRLELKLKQFAEVETLLMKECEQVERTRQRLAAERARMISTRFGPAGPNSQPIVATANNNNRQQVIGPSAAQANISGYGNNPPTHPHMSFMPRQQMFAFGPRLPLSVIHPSSSTPSTTGMFPSAPTSNPQALNHPILRPVSGTNTNVG
ncbi:SWITCH/sucrose nonfermenting 3C [Tasmannia lanceolata]|uniref:SWITCH/sucrose nonfermenting 3C n=1 Tax=Tasmannia lanceolata TaxID=3420 RepID=UPI004063E324